MGAEDPAFEQARHPVHARHHDMRGIGRRRERHCVVGVGMLREFVVAAPGVGEHDRARSDRVADERHETVTRGVGDVAQTHTPESSWSHEFDGDHDDALRGPTTAFAAVVDAADEGLVDFDLAREGIPVHPHHRHPVAVQHRPGDLVRHTERLSEGEGRHSVLRRHELPAGLEPSPKWGAGLVEDRPRRHRRLMPARSADQATTALAPRLAYHSTHRAPEPLRPAKALEVGATGLLVREPSVEVPPMGWIVPPRYEGR